MNPLWFKIKKLKQTLKNNKHTINILPPDDRKERGKNENTHDTQTKPQQNNDRYIIKYC